MKRLTLLSSVFLFLFFNGIKSQGFSDNFNAGTIGTGWVGNGNYGLTQSGGYLKVDVSKGTANQFFTLNLGSTIDITSNPILNLKLRGDDAYTMRVTIYSSGGTSASKEIRVPVITSTFVNYCFDFTAFAGKNQVNKIEFATNPQANSYGGNMYFEDLILGTGALKFANLSQIGDIVVYKGSTGLKILVTDILNAGSITVGASALITGVTPSAITAGVCTITFAAAAAAGSDIITVTAVGASGYTDNTSTFNLTVEDNNVPAINKPSDIGVPTGKATPVKLTGISDGNGSIEQTLTITAVSSNAAAIPDPVITYVQGSPYASLSLNPASAGTATITVTVQDDGATNNTQTTTFDVTAFAGFNNAPSIKEPPKQSIINKSPFKINVLLSGISDGDGGTQVLTITAAGKTGKVTPSSPVTYIAGKDTATLTLTAAALGKDTITVTLTDDGDDGSNNGDQTTVITIPVEVLAPAPTGYKVVMNTFAADTAAKLWTIEGLNSVQYADYVDTLGQRSLRLQLKLKMDWTGLWYNLDHLPLELDVTNAPYMSYEIYSPNINPLATHAYFWDTDSSRNAQGAHLERDTIVGMTGFTKVFLDFRKPGYLNNDKGVPMNAGRVVLLLFNYHKNTMKWPNTFINGTIYIRNIRVGDSCLAADIPTNTPLCTVDPVPTKVLWTGSGVQTQILTGISNGKGNTTDVVVTTLSSKPTLLPAPTLGTLGADGKLTITYTPAATLDSAQIIMRINCTGSIQKEMRFWVKTASDVAANAVEIYVDATTKGQKIVGFGGHHPPELLLDQYTQDQGCTMMRTSIDWGFEKANDNSNPSVLDRSKFTQSLVDFNYYKKAYEAGVTDIFVTLWAPPAWMMQSLSSVWIESAPDWAVTTQKVDPIYYDEYVEYMVAIVRMIKEETGVEIAGFCPQNEPAFTEPYGSGILDPAHMATVCGMLGKRLSDEGFGTKVINSEQVFGQGHYPVIQYINSVKADPLANQYNQVIGMHYPDANAAMWSLQWNACKSGTYPKEYWATECETEGNNYKAILDECNGMITGLNYGCGAWVVWGYNNGVTGDEYNVTKTSGMTFTLGKSIHYHAFKNFAKFIRKGADQLKSTSSNANVKVAAFNHVADSMMTIVLLNLDSKLPYTIKLTGSAPTSGWDAYRTSFYEKCEKVDPFKNGLVALSPQSITTLTMKTDVNHAPTINKPGDKFMPINGTTNINLTGISSGDPSPQVITITATSSDPSIIPNPTVTYTSPATTGLVAITSVADKHGAVTITVKVKDDGGTAKSGVDTALTTCLVTIPSSLDDLSDKVSLYPNPADEKLTLIVPSELSNAKVSITNTLGVVVKEQKLAGENQADINVSDLTSGTYLINISNNSGEAKLRFSKK